METHNIFTVLVPITSIKKSYSDQTGRFPVKSSRGNQYVFIMYNYNTNSINSNAIKDMNSHNIVEAWLTTFNLSKYMGHAPKNTFWITNAPKISKIRLGRTVSHFS